MAEDMRMQLFELLTEMNARHARPKPEAGDN